MMRSIASRLDAIAGLSQRASLPTPGNASAAVPYAAACTLLGEIGEHIGRVRPGFDDAAFVRPDDIARARACLHNISVDIESVAGFASALSDRDTRVSALGRVISNVQTIRVALGIVAVDAI